VVDTRRLEKDIARGATIVLDTPVLIAYLEGKQAITEAATFMVDSMIHSGRNRAIVSTISAAELLVGVKRAQREENAVLDFLTHFQNVECVPVDLRTAREAAGIRARTNLKVSDSIILAVGALRANSVVATNDRAWANKCPDMSIVTLMEFSS